MAAKRRGDTCKWAGCWDLDAWGDSLFESMQKAHSDPVFVLNEVKKRAGTKDLHRLQTYRLAVRQGCRERGLPVRLK